MDVIRAEGPLLKRILDASHPLWADGLSREAYGRYNEAQLRTPWGSHRLGRYALVDQRSRLLSSAKRYDLTVTIDHQRVRAVGLGAVFTPEEERGCGYAPVLMNRILDAARADGARIAVLFSDIGTSYYKRLGFSPLTQTELTLSIACSRGTPMVPVRSGEDRDIPAVANLATQMAQRYRFSIAHSEETIRFSLSKKRLLAGLSTSGALTVEFFIVEEGGAPAAFAIVTTAGEADVVLEMCGDRDPTGARVGAMLQLLRARNPAEAPYVVRAMLPPRWLPPQLAIHRSQLAPSVMMTKPLDDGVLDRPLTEPDVLYWHGDLF